MALKLDEVKHKKLIDMIDGNTQLEWFDSAIEFADHLEKFAKPSNEKRARDGDLNWYGGETWKDAMANVKKGWPHVVDKAEKIIKQIEDEGLLSAGYKGWTQSVAGIFPCVPAAIIGAPESMFDRAEDKSEQSAIRVVVDNVMYWGISADAILRRGTAIAAFVLGLSAKRPVELYCMAGLDANPNKRAGYANGFASAVVRIETRPMDIASLSYCLASAGFYRRLQMGYAEEYGFTGMFAYNDYNALDPGKPEYEPAMRRALMLEPQDVFIPGELRESKISSDPVGWVTEQLSVHLIENQNSEEAA